MVESLTDAALELRCPLCGSIFEAGAVSTAAEAAPPWALPVVDEAAQPADSVPDSMAGDAGADEPAEYAISGASASDHETSRPEGAIDVPAEGFAEHAPYSIAEIAAAVDGGSASGDSPQSEGWPAAAGGSNSSPVWNAIGEHAEELASQPSRARRREPQIGMLGHLIGVVLGGVVGIGLGYLVLLWMAGRQGDFLHIWDQMPRMLLPSEHLQRSLPPG